MTSTAALELEKIPESLLIVGAGVIGCEFASFFAELGTKITMVEMMPQMLPLEDKRLAKQFQSVYRKRGIEVLLKTKVESIAEYADDHVIGQALRRLARSPPRRSWCRWAASPTAPASAWRRWASRPTPAATSWSNDYLRDHRPRRLRHRRRQRRTAAGPRRLVRSVRGRGQLPGRPAGQRDLRSTPSCTYSTPEVASVGLNEEQAVESGYQPVTGTYRFAALGKAMAMGEETGYVQLIADKETDVVLGASMMGAHVTDVIHEVAVAVQNGLTVKQLGDTIHAHPTIAEAVMEAAHDVHGESVHIARRRVTRSVGSDMRRVTADRWRGTRSATREGAR